MCSIIIFILVIDLTEEATPSKFKAQAAVDLTKASAPPAVSHYDLTEGDDSFQQRQELRDVKKKFHFNDVHRERQYQQQHQQPHRHPGVIDLSGVDDDDAVPDVINVSSSELNAARGGDDGSARKTDVHEDILEGAGAVQAIRSHPK